MLLYIKNLLPRLRQYSQSLDRIELLVEHPWVLIDKEMNQHKYIFRRNGDLLMSINGKGIKGKWEYLSVAKSLWIDRGQDNIMLNHDFIDPAVMILKMDGNKDMPFVLANENLVPNMDVVNYLEQLVTNRGVIGTVQLANGVDYKTKNGTITIDQTGKHISVGDKAYIKGAIAPDGRYWFNWVEFLQVEDGRILYNHTSL